MSEQKRNWPWRTVAPVAAVVLSPLAIRLLGDKGVQRGSDPRDFFEGVSRKSNPLKSEGEGGPLRTDQPSRGSDYDNGGRKVESKGTYDERSGRYKRDDDRVDDDDDDIDDSGSGGSHPSYDPSRSHQSSYGSLDGNGVVPPAGVEPEFDAFVVGGTIVGVVAILCVAYVAFNSRSRAAYA